MKVCSLKRFLKYTILISLTSFITTIVYHYVRHGHDDQGYSKSSQNEYLLENFNRVARSAKIDWHDHELIKQEKKRKGISLSIHFFKLVPLR